MMMIITAIKTLIYLDEKTDQLILRELLRSISYWHPFVLFSRFILYCIVFHFCMEFCNCTDVK